MNGKTISNTTDIWNEAEYAWSFISVQENAKLTITGNGTFDAKENDCYAIDIRDGGKLTIENGIYKGNCHAIYVSEGSLFVNGGEFSVKQKFSATQPDEFVLNCYDPNYRRKDLGTEPNVREYTGPANIEVSGGTFHNFNPGNCEAEGAKTDFLKPGYISVADESNPTIFNVVPITEEGHYEAYSDLTATLGCAIDKIMKKGPDDTIVQNIEDDGNNYVIYFNKTTVTLESTDLAEFDIQTESNITVVLQGKMIMHGNLETSTIEYIIYDFRSNTSIATVNHKLYKKVLYGNDYPEELIIDDKIITDFRSSTT